MRYKIVTARFEQCLKPFVTWREGNELFVVASFSRRLRETRGHTEKHENVWKPTD